MSSIRKIAIAASIAGTVATVGATAASAAPLAPHITPANTVVTGNLKSGTTFQFAGTLGGQSILVTCTTVTASGKTPASGLTINLTKSPTFTGCSDNLGGADTVKTTGKWKLTANRTGSTLTMTVPVKGATFFSSVLPSCVVTVAPKSAQKIAGKYDNVSTWTITNSKFAVSAPAACGASPTATATGTEVFSPGFRVAP